MSKFTLDDILNAVTIPLEIDGVEFRLVPMNSRAIAAWNRVQAEYLDIRKQDGETLAAMQERREKVEEKQQRLLAEHMRGCVTGGDAKKVTTKWLGETLPQPALQDLAAFLVESRRPAWAEATDSGK